MSDIEDQKKLTDGKGWKFVKESYAKEKKEQITTKAKNVIAELKSR